MTSNITDELNKKLDPKHVKERSKGYTSLSYVEGWHVIDELNRVFGFDGWDRITTYNKEISNVPVKIGKAQEGGFKVGYEAKVELVVYFGDRVINRQGTGYGSQSSKDLFDCYEGAGKEAETDAMKRAAMTLGNRFGLALYDKTKANVGVEPQAVVPCDWFAHQFTRPRTTTELVTWFAGENVSSYFAKQSEADQLSIGVMYEKKKNELDKLTVGLKNGE